MVNYKDNLPHPGEVVSITTRRHSYVIGHEGYKFHTYNNVKVLESAQCDPPNSFRIEGSGKQPEKIICMSLVSTLKRGASTYIRKYKKGPSAIKIIKITGSKGDIYKIKMEGNKAVSCTCPGFHYRKTCRHLAEAEEK